MKLIELVLMSVPCLKLTGEKRKDQKVDSKVRSFEGIQDLVFVILALKFYTVSNIK